AEWEAVDFLYGLGQFRRIEQRSLYVLRIAFEALVGAEPSTRRSAQLSTDGFFLGGDKLHGLPHKIVMVLLPRYMWRFRNAFGRFENLELRFRDAVSVLVDPCERVISFGRSQIYEHAVWFTRGGAVLPGGIDHRREGGNGALERGRPIDRVLPD